MTSQFFKRTLSTAALIALFAAVSAQAQTVPSSVDAGRVSQRFKPTSSPVGLVDIGLPIPGEQKELPKAQQDSLSKVKFTLKSVTVEGATAFTSDELKTTYESKLGKQISLLDAETIARDITSMYQKAGYVLSQAVVPQQEISKGTLKIRVVEGFVSNVVIQGDNISESERTVIASYLDNVLGKHPISKRDLERTMLLINDLPGANVRGLLRPAANELGAAELVVTMESNMFEGAVSADNRGSKYVGPFQYSAQATANSLFGLYDRTQIRFTTSSPVRELRSFEVQHEEMLGSDGTKLALLASRTNTEPGDSLKNVDIVGTSDMVEAKLSHPFIRSRQETLSMHLGFDFHNSDTDVFDNVNFTEDRLRIARIGGVYNFADSWYGNNLIDAEVSKGLNIFNASESGANRTNAIGESDFTKLTLDLSRIQVLTGDFSLFASASGQYAMDPLLVSEQFSLGGTSFGNAYDPAEVLGDHGVAGKLELRYTQSVDADYLSSYQLFGYYDVGRAWIRDGAAGANDKRSLASVGGGVRSAFTDSVSGALEVGVPLTKPASNQGGHAHDPRIFFSTTAKF